MIELRERTGFPGMKILQFAFNPDDESIDSPHLAPNNSVMYTGTHDNNTVLGWYRMRLTTLLAGTWLSTPPTVRSTKLITSCNAAYNLCFSQLYGHCDHAGPAGIEQCSTDELSIHNWWQLDLADDS